MSASADPFAEEHSDDAATEAPTPRPRRPRWRVLLASGALLLAGGLVAAAAVGGWGAANSVVVSAKANPVPEVVTIALPDYDPDVAARMPDVRGLSQAAAAQVIADAGIPTSVVTVVSRAAAGPAGVVVQQTPVFGTANPSTIQIVLSEPATIPNAVGTDAAGAIAQLQSLGARVTQVRDYVPGAAVGTVAAIDPAPGSGVPAQVTVTIADSPSTKPLSELSAATGSAGRSSDVLVDGTLRTSAVTISASSSARTVAWALGGSVTSVDGSLGVLDSAAAGSSVTVTVTADGEQIAQYAVGKGTPQPFSWTVRGASTLALTVVDPGKTGTGLLLLDTNLLGTHDRLARLK